jgi:hypothetical protein
MPPSRKAEFVPLSSRGGVAGEVVIFGGGVPIVFNGQLIGAVGTSAGTVEQDIAVAQAALVALDRDIRRNAAGQMPNQKHDDYPRADFAQRFIRNGDRSVK